MFTVIDIKLCPEHVGAVAAWVHREWWASKAPVEALTSWVEGCISSDGFPATLVAVSEGRPIGSVFLHPTEAEDRPAYKPYLGALYVEPQWRGKTVGRALVHAVERHAAALRFRRMFLNAAPHRASFYEELGWSIIERANGPHGLNIMRRDLSAGLDE
jgi:GNAT superfamily N-acetyltransferase